MNESKFNWQKWSAMAEIFSAIAVIASLVYVGIGLRENTKAIQGSTYQQIVSESDKMLLAGATNAGLAEILEKAWSDSVELTPVEGLRLFFYDRNFWRNMENVYFQHKREVLDEQGWEVYKRIMCSGDQKITWKYQAPWLSEEFVKFIEDNTK
jgi:hypothetical protein